MTTVTEELAQLEPDVELRAAREYRITDSGEDQLFACLTAFFRVGPAERRMFAASLTDDGYCVVDDSPQPIWTGSWVHSDLHMLADEIHDWLLRLSPAKRLRMCRPFTTDDSRVPGADYFYMTDAEVDGFQGVLITPAWVQLVAS